MDDLEAYAPNTLLTGRLALVTGAGQGNGRMIAQGLAQAGASVIVTDIHEGNAVEVSRCIAADGGQSWAYPLDVTDEMACQTLAQRVRAEVGMVDLLVNNAGIIVREGSDSPRAGANWRRTFDVNVNGVFNVTQAFLPSLRAKRGTIVNVSSIAAYVGQGGPLGYAPSKGAIKLYTQSLAAELGAEGVRVNAIAPGLIATPMNEEARKNPSFLEGFMNRTPLRRVGQPADLVGPVVFLSSRMSEYITGVTLAVDGGYLAV